jgi:uncharacterized protein (UPF0332 family)
MFYLAEALLNREGLAFSDHAGVSAFGQYLARLGKVPVEFRQYLIDAQAQRTRADDDLNPDLSHLDAELLISRAQILLTIALQNFAAS